MAIDKPIEKMDGHAPFDLSHEQGPPGTNREPPSKQGRPAHRVGPNPYGWYEGFGRPVDASYGQGAHARRYCNGRFGHSGMGMFANSGATVVSPSPADMAPGHDPGRSVASPRRRR